MPSGLVRSPSLGIQPRLPVWILWVDGLPKILAGGVPVVPFNTALRHRARHDGATRKSLAAYARAAALYTTYCVHQRVGLLDVANDEFPSFVDGLLGLRFRNGSGVRPPRRPCPLPRQRRPVPDAAVLTHGRRRAPLRRLIRLAALPEGSRLRRRPHCSPRAHLLTGLGQRVHRIRHTARKVVGLPDRNSRKCCEGPS